MYISLSTTIASALADSDSFNLLTVKTPRQPVARLTAPKSTEQRWRLLLLNKTARAPTR